MDRYKNKLSLMWMKNGTQTYFLVVERERDRYCRSGIGDLLFSGCDRGVNAKVVYSMIDFRN